VKNTDSALPQSINDSWYRLRLFNYFRCSLALLFIIIYLKGWLVRLVPDAAANIDLYITISTVYFIVSLLFIVGIFRKKPGLDSQVIIQTMVDIACIITLMHATGGLKTGLGTLLIISISMTSIFLQKRITILFAAISALAIIAEQIYSQLTDPLFSPAFTQAGLLGILIFVSAALASLTAKRLKESELQAERARQELEAIVQMNENIIRKMRTAIGYKKQLPDSKRKQCRTRTTRSDKERRTVQPEKHFNRSIRSLCRLEPQRYSKPYTHPATSGYTRYSAGFQSNWPEWWSRQETTWPHLDFYRRRNTVSTTFPAGKSWPHWVA